MGNTRSFKIRYYESDQPVLDKLIEQIEKNVTTNKSVPAKQIALLIDVLSRPQRDVRGHIKYRKDQLNAEIFNFFRAEDQRKKEYYFFEKRPTEIRLGLRVGKEQSEFLSDLTPAEMIFSLGGMIDSVLSSIDHKFLLGDYEPASQKDKHKLLKSVFRIISDYLVEGKVEKYSHYNKVVVTAYIASKFGFTITEKEYLGTDYLSQLYSTIEKMFRRYKPKK